MGWYIVTTTDGTHFKKWVEADSAREAVENNFQACDRKAEGRYLVGIPFSEVDEEAETDCPRPVDALNPENDYGSISKARMNAEEGEVVWDRKEKEIATL